MKNQQATINELNRELEDMHKSVLESAQAARTKSAEIAQLNDRMQYLKDNAKADKEAALSVQAYQLNREFLKKLGDAEDKIAELERENVDSVTKETEKLRAELNETKKSLAVAEARNQLLEDALRTNEDVLEVKNIVSDLIKVLPRVDLKNLSIINTGDNGSKSK